MPQQSEIIDLMRAKHRERCFAMEQRKRLNLALGSFLRLVLGWRKDLPEAERKAIAAEAARMIDEGDGSWAEGIAANAKGTGRVEKLENDSKRERANLAVWLL